MKILLATDGSNHSQKAIEKIANRPFPPGTEIKILSVYEKLNLTMHMEPMGALREYHAEIDRNALKSAEDATKMAATVLRENNDLKITTVVLEGSPKNVILDEAEKFGADLIVLGSHGYGAIKSFLIGSVSHSVALHAKCSVEIVR
jgi:nucleotide-binding universal stress UspA family protein